MTRAELVINTEGRWLLTVTPGNACTATTTCPTDTEGRRIAETLLETELNWTRPAPGIWHGHQPHRLPGHYAVDSFDVAPKYANGASVMAANPAGASSSAVTTPNTTTNSPEKDGPATNGSKQGSSPAAWAT